MHVTDAGVADTEAEAPAEPVTTAVADEAEVLSVVAPHPLTPNHQWTQICFAVAGGSWKLGHCSPLAQTVLRLCWQLRRGEVGCCVLRTGVVQSLTLPDFDHLLKGLPRLGLLLFCPYC